MLFQKNILVLSLLLLPLISFADEGHYTENSLKHILIDIPHDVEERKKIEDLKGNSYSNEDDILKDFENAIGKEKSQKYKSSILKYTKQSTIEESADGFKEFYGIKFGIGFALTFKHGDDRIYSASIDGNGIVRVDKEANREPKVMLETHYFWHWKSLSNFLERPCGIGPFFGVQPDNSNGGVIGSYALGGMIGLKHNSEPEETNSRSWNIGAAYVVNTGVRTLGDGLKQGKPLPDNETQIRYKEINQPGWLIMISFSY